MVENREAGVHVAEFPTAKETFSDVWVRLREGLTPACDSKEFKVCIEGTVEDGLDRLCDRSHNRSLRYDEEPPHEDLWTMAPKPGIGCSGPYKDCVYRIEKTMGLHNWIVAEAEHLKVHNQSHGKWKPAPKFANTSREQA